MEAINWEAVQAVSEALGLIVVIGSLIFVGFQIRQNAKATRAASMNNIMESWGEAYTRISENENLAEIVWSGAQDPNQLSDVPRWRFALFVNGIFYSWHNAYYQWTIGTYEAQAWAGQADLMTNILHLPGIRTIWDERKQTLPKDFQILLHRYRLDFAKTNRSYGADLRQNQLRH